MARPSRSRSSKSATITRSLLEDIEAAAKFARTKTRKRTPPPVKLALTLKQRRHRLRLPNLVAVVNCPTIKANGQLLTEPGFDGATGILFDPHGVAFPPVPDQPTKATAELALKRLSRLIETFDFVSKDDLAVALSLILTAIARPGLPNAPLHGFDAPAAGAGKSKLVDIASILATGHEAGVTAQGEDREEAEKRLSALLMRGDPIIALDNCEAPLEGVLINQTLTQTRVELRILGMSKVVTARCASLITAIGNNLVVKGDLTRRAVIGRLDPKVARPELRQYAYDPIADAKANRGELVAAALTILRAYETAGRPNRPPRLQSFEQWSDFVRGALIWLGAGDPTATMDRLRKRDPVLASLTAVLHAWHAAFAFEPVTARRAIDTADEKPDLRDALMAVAGRGGKIDARALGSWLAHHAAEAEVAAPSHDVWLQLFDQLLQTEPPCPACHVSDPPLEFVESLWRDAPLAPVIRDAEPKKLALFRPRHRALRLVDLEPQLVGQEPAHRGHDPFAGTTTANIDVAVVGVPAKAVTASGQFLVEVVKHEIA